METLLVNDSNGAATRTSLLTILALSVGDYDMWLKPLTLMTAWMLAVVTICVKYGNMLMIRAAGLVPVMTAAIRVKIGWEVVGGRHQHHHLNLTQMVQPQLATMTANGNWLMHLMTLSSRDSTTAAIIVVKATWLET